MDKTEKIVSAIPSAAELEQLAELHKAMGDHTRMRILWHLTQKEYCVSDLAKEIGVTESALSHQLRALRIVRLVRSRKEGKKVIYSLQDEHIGWVLEETLRCGQGLRWALVTGFRRKPTGSSGYAGNRNDWCQRPPHLSSRQPGY